MHIKVYLLALFLSILPLPAQALWSGISAFVGEDRSNWSVGQSRHQAESFVYGLSLEERTRPGLRIGLTGGRFSLDIEPSTQTARDGYDGEFLQLHLRWPYSLLENIKLHTRFDYRFNRGRHDQLSNDSKIDWSERSASAGISLRIDQISLRPFIRYLSVDGDIKLAGSNQPFKSSDSVSHGLMLDVHVDASAYVRLRSEFSAVESLQIHFVRGF